MGQHMQHMPEGLNLAHEWNINMTSFRCSSEGHPVFTWSSHAPRWVLAMESRLLRREHWRKSNQWFLLTRKHAQVACSLGFRTFYSKLLPAGHWKILRDMIVVELLDLQCLGFQRVPSNLAMKSQKRSNEGPPSLL